MVAAVIHFRVYLLAQPFVLRTDHKALTWLFSKGTKASARISSWIATLLEYPIVVEYIKGTQNIIADELSRFKCHAVDQVVFPELANGTISFACPASDADRLELQTHWLNEQCADPTIARVMRCVDAVCKPDADEIELNPSLQKYPDVWNTLVENGMLRHVNEGRHLSCIVVPPLLRDDVMRSLHLPAHLGFESTLRRITQHFWWPRIRGDVSTFVRACDVCDRYRCSNPNPRTSLGQQPADNPFAVLYIDIVGGKGFLSLSASPKSILSIINGLTGWAEAVPIEDQRRRSCTPFLTPE